MINLVLALAGFLVLSLIGLIFLFKRNQGLKEDFRIEKARANQGMVRAEKLVILQANQQNIREAANYEKNELAECDDASLFDRSNALFP